MSKSEDILLAALKDGAAAGGEVRLYRSGKLPGLFPNRNSQHAELASQAIRDGLLEVVRTETKGKAPVEWVKVTASGMDYIARHASPLEAMKELRDALRLNAEGLPAWRADMRRQINDLERRCLEEIEAIGRRLDMLANQVQFGLKKLDKAEQLPEGALGNLSWGDEILAYLQRRDDGGLGDKCPLPELFGVLRDKLGELSIKDFHSGLRRLQDRGALRLLRYEGGDGPAEPEFALLDGSEVFYYASA